MVKVSKEVRTCVAINQIVKRTIDRLDAEIDRIKKDDRLSRDAQNILINEATRAKERFRNLKCLTH